MVSSPLPFLWSPFRRLFPRHFETCSQLLCSADEVLKSVAYLPEMLFDPKTTHSQEQGDTAFVRAFNDPVWPCIQSEDASLHVYRRRLISGTMGLNRSSVNLATGRMLKLSPRVSQFSFAC